MGKKSKGSKGQDAKASARKKSSQRQGNATSKRKGGKAPLTRSTADRHALYQLSVQDAEFELDFIDKQFRKSVGRRPLTLREDFCGTALFCGAWAQSRADRSAVGIDLDSEVLQWGKQHNLEPLGDSARRVQLLQQDVMDAVEGQFDVCVAFNFSYWCFKERAVLRRYFEGVRRSLAADGVFYLDAYGGYESHQPDLEEPRKVKGGFTYIWHQDKVDPITNHVVNHIHFEFKDKTRWRNAFTYEWRFWSLPEIRELLEEAGFVDVTIYWDVAGEDDDASYRPRKSASNWAGWIAYISARPGPQS